MTVEEAEVDMAYEKLPGWRKPIGSLEDTFWSAETPRIGIREALYELAGPDPQTFAELAAALREQWGPASSASIRIQLRELVREGALVRDDDGGYTRAEPDGDR